MARSKSASTYPDKFILDTLKKVILEPVPFEYQNKAGILKGEYGVYVEPHLGVDQPYILVRQYVCPTHKSQIKPMMATLDIKSAPKGYSFKKFWPKEIQKMRNIYLSPPFEKIILYDPTDNSANIENYGGKLYETLMEIEKTSERALLIMDISLEIASHKPNSKVRIKIEY